jgi:hypothetical protein
MDESVRRFAEGEASLAPMGAAGLPGTAGYLPGRDASRERGTISDLIFWRE